MRNVAFVFDDQQVDQVIDIRELQAIQLVYSHITVDPHGSNALPGFLYNRSIAIQALYLDPIPLSEGSSQLASPDTKMNDKTAGNACLLQNFSRIPLRVCEKSLRWHHQKNRPQNRYECIEWKTQHDWVSTLNRGQGFRRVIKRNCIATEG